MERAHVLIRLCDCDDGSVDVARDNGVASPSLRVTPPKPSGVCRTSPTTVRLEHSDMSPGVASISFEQVYDHRHSSAEIFQHSLADGVARVTDGYAMTLITTGARNSGKSFTIHGDGSNDKKNGGARSSVGLLELAIAHVFGVVEGESQVLMACCYTDKTKDVLVDALTNRVVEKDPVDASADGAFLSIARRVASVEDATLVYQTARGERPVEDSDFVCVVYVETRARAGGVNRGRLVCIDIHGNSIIEPVVAMSNQHDVGSPTKPSLFADTQFPVNQPLTRWCGSLLGNEAATFILVAIHSAARRQQEAIQSLLYACKAKDIKSSPTQNEVISLSNSHAVMESGSLLPTTASEEEDGELVFLGSPVSSTSTHSTPSLLQSTTSGVQLSSSDLLSERLRQAYQSVKKSATKPASVRASTVEPLGDSSTVSMQTLHFRADSILRNSTSVNNLETMTLLEKFESIQSQYEDLEKALRHEASVKEKCVERISKLSQTMSFQVVEHEKQLQAKDAETQALRDQLDEMQAKYDDAEQTLERLQQQVEALKQTTRDRAGNSKSPVKMSNERMLLQQFSARLETAMLEAKSVVDHKDAIIRDMEARLAQFETANSDLEKQLRMKEAALERQAAEISIERGQWNEQTTALENALSRSRAQVEGNEERLMEATRNCKTLEMEWKAKMEKLQQEMEESSRFAHQQQGEEVSKRSAAVRELEGQLREQGGELHQTLLKSVATDAALMSASKRVGDLEAELDQVTVKLNKEKKKLEKKLRILMTERKQQQDETEKAESELADEVQRLNREIVAIQSELAARDSELERRQQLLAELEARATHAEQQHAVNQEQIGVLQDCIQQLESDKQALEQELDTRTYSLEQSVARQLVEQQNQLYAEFEHQLRDTMERHSAELLQRDLELNRLRLNRRAQPLAPAPLPSTTSSSMSSSLASSSSISDHSPPQQHDLDQLGAMLDGQPTQQPRYKKGRDARVGDKLMKQKQKIAMLKQQVESLTHALAVANEQETLAKQAIAQQQAQYERMMYAQEELQTQVNALKQENWSLSWVLQLTERRSLLTTTASNTQIET